MTNATLTIDKFSIISTLKTRGFTEVQAEGIAEALAKIDSSELVTKNNLSHAIKDLKVDILKFNFAIMTAQTALFVGLAELLLKH